MAATLKFSVIEKNENSLVNLYTVELKKFV